MSKVKPQMGIVEPKEWVSRTNLMLSKRGPTLVKADEAYAEYHKVRSQENAGKLHEALKAYLVEHGGNWEKVDRDKKSGGLMKFIYDHTADNVPLSPGANALKRRVPESRHGVIYLWKSAKVETQWVKIILEGAISAGGSVLTAADDLGKIPENMKTLATAGGVGLSVGGIGVKKAREGATTAEIKPLSQAPARGRSGAVTVNALIDKPMTLQSVKEFFGEKFSALFAFIKEKVLWVRDKVVEFWADKGGVIAVLSTIIEKAVLAILKEVAKAAAPFVGAGIDLGRGVFQTIAAIRDKAQAWFARRSFVIASGHPALIAGSIERQMAWGIGKGLYSALKGGLKLAGNFFSAGASAIVDAIAAAVEMVVKLFTRIAEAYFIKKWLGVVRDYGANRNDYVADPKDGVWRPRIVFNDKAFHTLFKMGCEASPCIPMLTLNSGISGDLMMFMKMFDDTGEMVNQQAFDKAAGYYSHLKQYGKQYILDTGFRFTSSDQVAQGLMWHAVNHHDSGKTSIVDGALKFLS